MHSIVTLGQKSIESVWQRQEMKEILTHPMLVAQRLGTATTTSNRQEMPKLLSFLELTILGNFKCQKGLMGTLLYLALKASEK